MSGANSNYPFQCLGNLIAGYPKSGGAGGSILITNGSNSNNKDTSASLSFIVAGSYDMSGNTYTSNGNIYGNSRGIDYINSGGFVGASDKADVRITAIIDTATGASKVGTACTFKVSPDSTADPVEAMRISSSGNVGIGTQNPLSTLDVYNASGAGVIKLQGNTLNNIGIGNTTLTNIRSGSSNTGFGLGTLASVTTGASNTAVGHNALQYGTLGGSYNTAVGFGALANNNANNYNTALGHNAFKTNSGNYTQSTAIGYSAQPTDSNQIMMGTNTESVIIPGANSNTLGTSGSGALQVTGGAGIAGNLTVDGNISIDNRLYVGYPIPTYMGNTLQVNGAIGATGQITGLSFNATSDYRMKNNIQPLMETKSIDVLNPVEYDLVGGSHDMGFLAHEVQEKFPFLVTGVKDGPKMQSLNYNGLFALLVKEIKDIKKRLADTEETIKQLTNK
jgi:hypothetical protein